MLKIVPSAGSLPETCDIIMNTVMKCTEAGGDLVAASVPESM